MTAHTSQCVGGGQRPVGRVLLIEQCNVPINVKFGDGTIEGSIIATLVSVRRTCHFNFFETCAVEGDDVVSFVCFFCSVWFRPLP
jgi:hypothetical protein